MATKEIAVLAKSFKKAFKLAHEDAKHILNGHYKEGVEPIAGWHTLTFVKASTEVHANSRDDHGLITFVFVLEITEPPQGT